MQQIWGLVRALQLIILIQLVDVNIPGNLFVFVQESIKIAAMDILNGEEFFASNFEFKETSPYNDNFK